MKKKIKVPAFINKAAKTLSENSPRILTGLAVVGVVTTVIFAVKATKEAVMLMQEEDFRKIREENPFEYDGETTNLTVLETVKICWKPYVPVAIMGSLTIACILMSHRANEKRAAALASLYSLSERAFDQYRRQVEEKIGKGQEKKIRDGLQAKKVEMDPISESTVVDTGVGTTICYDAFSGRYFKYDIEKLRQAVNDLNRQILTDGFISLNEFYWEIGLAPTKLGDYVGWDVDHGLMDERFSSTLTDRKEPCLVVDYDNITPKPWKW